MQIRTATTTLAAGAAEVFAFLSDLRNLPAWATEFCSGIRRDGLRWLAETSQGPMIVAVRADGATGVIDLFAGPTADALALFPLRVLPQGRGSAVSFTFVQPDDLSDESYERQYRSLLVELRGLIRRFGGGKLHAEEPRAVPFYPSVVTANFRETVDFYTELFGFRVLDDSPHHVQLAHPSGVNFGVLRHETDGLPAELINGTDGRGFWLTLNVADADAEYDRLRELGADIVEPPENKPWDERVLIVRDPNGLLIFVAHKIPPATPWWVPANPEAFLARM